MVKILTEWKNRREHNKEQILQYVSIYEKPNQGLF